MWLDINRNGLHIHSVHHYNEVLPLGDETENVEPQH